MLQDEKMKELLSQLHEKGSNAAKGQCKTDIVEALGSIHRKDMQKKSDATSRQMLIDILGSSEQDAQDVIEFIQFVLFELNSYDRKTIIRRWHQNRRRLANQAVEDSYLNTGIEFNL